MGAFPLGALLLPLALAAGPDPGADTGPGRPVPGGELPAEDARYLDWLIEDFLFDPRGAVRVRLSYTLDDREPVPVPEDRTGYRDGWLVLSTKRIHFAGGDSIPIPTTGVREVDYESECDRRYPPERWRLSVPDSDFVPFAAARQLTDAAWLHRRGYGRLAARALAAARAAGDDPAAELRARLAAEAARALCEAFARRADVEAEEHGRRAMRLAADPVPLVTAVLADLDRRRRAGTFGKPGPGWPAGFAGWDDRRKAAYLIDTLDEIGTAREGYRDPIDHPRCEALVELGDAAVPGLIDALEGDDRRTRFLELSLGKAGRDLRHEQDLVSVRQVVGQVLDRIVRVSNLEPRLPEEEDDRTPAATAGRYRRYWAAYGHLAFDERMLVVLTDPACRPAARAEAADELVDRFPAGRTSWVRRKQAVPPALRADRARVVDAILAALDDEREREGRRRRPSYEERTYLRSLVLCGDRRAGPELARWATEETTVRSRTAYALAAHDLGASGTLVGLSREVAAGTLDLFPPTRRPGNRSRRAVPDTLGQLLVGLTRSRLPEAGDALAALADPSHPYHPLLVADLLANRPNEFEWASDPFVLGVLWAALGDRRPTGVDYFLRDDEVEVIAGARSTRHPVPAGAAGWREHAAERVADAAAARLSELAAGLPAPHPLRPDADRVLADLRAGLARYAGRFRPLTHDERSRLIRPGADLGFGPDIRPLGRPATAADVRAGRAVFELGGRGRVAEVKLPAWVTLKVDAVADDPAWGLVVQAEVGPDGTVVYGVVFRHAIRTVRADEVGQVEPGESR